MTNPIEKLNAARAAKLLDREIRYSPSHARGVCGPVSDHVVVTRREWLHALVAAGHRPGSDPRPNKPGPCAVHPLGHWVTLGQFEATYFAAIALEADREIQDRADSALAAPDA
jgi:hypothetical protein